MERFLITAKGFRWRASPHPRPRYERECTRTMEDGTAVLAWRPPGSCADVSADMGVVEQPAAVGGRVPVVHGAALLDLLEALLRHQLAEMRAVARARIGNDDFSARRGMTFDHACEERRMIPLV